MENVVKGLNVVNAGLNPVNVNLNAVTPISVTPNPATPTAKTPTATAKTPTAKKPAKSAGKTATATAKARALRYAKFKAYEAKKGAVYGKGTNAYAVFSVLKAGKGITTANAVKTLTGKVKTANLKARVTRVFSVLVKRGVATKNNGLYFLTAPKAGKTAKSAPNPATPTPTATANAVTPNPATV